MHHLLVLQGHMTLEYILFNINALISQTVILFLWNIPTWRERFFFLAS